jgi:uncharacterized protein (TIGR02145 family)
MKRIIFLGIFYVTICNFTMAQAPQLMSYQAVIWDAAGHLVSDKAVNIKLSILQGSVTGISVYTEFHKIQTNENGLVSLMIGGGSIITGNMSDISWEAGPYFLKTETDPTGGNNFMITGITQFVSVPYSLASNYSNIAGMARNISTKNTGLPGQVLTIDKDGKLMWSSNPPVLSTISITEIKSNTALSGGNISSDGGSPVTSRGVVWSIYPNPSVSLSTKTIDGSGVGFFTSNMTNLVPNTVYYVRAYASNGVGTSYGNEVTFTTNNPLVVNVPCPGTPSVKDTDGNTYNTVLIGTQCWMKENLKVTKYKDGTNIPLDTTGGPNGNASGQSWSGRNMGSRTVYGHKNENLTTYGYLYNGFATSDKRGICPDGWHIPTDDEWLVVTDFLGGPTVAGGKMKSTGTTFWYIPNEGASDESGFSALPGGNRDLDGKFNLNKYNAFFWSASEEGSNAAWYFYLYYYSGISNRFFNFNVKNFGASVRCLRN